MKVAVLKETNPNESRVGLVPEGVKFLKKKDIEVVVEKGAGSMAGFPDTAYEAEGAAIAPDAGSTVKGAEIVLKVLPLLGLAILRELLGVPARVLGVPAEVGHVDEGGPEALDLLLGGRADVVGLDLGAQASGGGDGLQACHTGPQDHDLGRRDGPRGGGEHGEELADGVGAQEDRLVPRHGGLGG